MIIWLITIKLQIINDEQFLLWWRTPLLYSFNISFDCCERCLNWCWEVVNYEVAFSFISNIYLCLFLSYIVWWGRCCFLFDCNVWWCIISDFHCWCDGWFPQLIPGIQENIVIYFGCRRLYSVWIFVGWWVMRFGEVWFVVFMFIFPVVYFGWLVFIYLVCFF